MPAFPSGPRRSKAVFMISVGRSLRRFCLLAGLGLLISPSSVVPSTASAAQPNPAGAQARYDVLRPTEVRLRKLHIVRPDLIPYPIEYEVVC